MTIKFITSPPPETFPHRRRLQSLPRMFHLVQGHLLAFPAFPCCSITITWNTSPFTIMVISFISLYKNSFSNLLFIMYSAISHNGKSWNAIPHPGGTRQKSYPYIGKDKQRCRNAIPFSFFLPESSRPQNKEQDFSWYQKGGVFIKHYKTGLSQLKQLVNYERLYCNHNHKWISCEK